MKIYSMMSVGLSFLWSCIVMQLFMKSWVLHVGHSSLLHGVMMNPRFANIAGVGFMFAMTFMMLCLGIGCFMSALCMKILPYLEPFLSRFFNKNSEGMHS